MRSVVMSAVTTCYAPGDILPNGAKVYESERGPEGEVVLADWGHVWVTWIIAKDGRTVRGNYFGSYNATTPREAAYHNFRRRVAGRA